MLREIRYEVFVREQKVPEDLELDGLDPECLHALAFAAEGEVIGCGRLLPDGHIGRMAVRSRWRGQGVGSALLQHLMKLAAEAGHDRAVLHAQTHAMEFYRRHGFEPVGEEFMDAGIAHRTMQRAL